MTRDTLSPRKLEVACHIADGLSDRQIAALMGITWQCVRRHIEGIERTWALDKSKNLRVQIAVRVDRCRSRSA